MANRLLTNELVKAFESHQLYSQDEKGVKAVCICVFQIGNIKWYVLEGQKEGDDFIIYSIVVGMGDTEYGYASLNEMEQIQVKTGLASFPVAKIIQDKSFQPQMLKDIKDEKLQTFLHRMYN